MKELSRPSANCDDVNWLKSHKILARLHINKVHLNNASESA